MEIQACNLTIQETDTREWREVQGQCVVHCECETLKNYNCLQKKGMTGLFMLSNMHVQRWLF